MKRFITLLSAVMLVITLSSCGIDKKRADELALDFISSMLIRDEAAMTECLHPDHTETALPDDGFYKDLEENHFFVLGNDITALDSVGKNYVEKTELDGTVLQCKYVLRSNELFYDVELLILENENGYGIVAVSTKLNTDPVYYAGSAEQ